MNVLINFKFISHSLITAYLKNYPVITCIGNINNPKTPLLDNQNLIKTIKAINTILFSIPLDPILSKMKNRMID